MRLLAVGDRAVLLELATMDAVHRAWAAIREQPPAGVEDVVAGARTVLVITAGRAAAQAVAASLPEPSGEHGHRPAPRTVRLPVCYDGPDLDEVAEMAGVLPSNLARIHSAPTYRVGFLGFSPGFAYLFGGDRRLDVPRLATPRTSVPAGSVALAADMTAVYPQATPGGWRLIGRTGATMFDPRRGEPALLAPGDLVRFEPVGQAEEFVAASLRSALAPVAPGAPAVEVIDPGPLLTIQDGGRPGWAHAGVPVAGAADRTSAARANRLVGNPASAAVLESTLGQARLRLRAKRTVAVTGARADVTVDGLPARRDVGLTLPAGAELAIGQCREGARVYVAFAGGLDVEEVLGSRSTDTLSGLGPPALRAGDMVAVAPAAPSGPVGPVPPPTAIPRRDEVLIVEARWGPRETWLAEHGLRAFSSSEFVVGPASDRTGVRLDGPSVALARRAEIPSEGMVAGAVQLPPGGGPIVLMRNHPPTGGYPVVAVVDDAGVDALAQALPGQRVRFALRPRVGQTFTFP